MSANRKKSRRFHSFEVLEDRLALNVAPVISNLPDEITLYAGTSYHLAINGYDDDLDQISYAISDSGNLNGLEATIPTGRSVSITYSQEIDGAVQSLGTIVLQLFENDAPLSTQQFATLVESGFYEGLTVHRIVDDFMFQGGDPTGTGSGYSSLDNIPDEVVDYLQHSSPGIVAYANSNNAASGRTNTSNCQFYIMDAPYPYLDGGYNVFGFVTSGSSVCETISAIETEYNSSGEKSKPINTVKMSEVSLFQDYDNGVLRLNALDSATGSTTIVVSATDESGNITYKEIQVNIISSASADSLESNLPDNIVLSAGTEKIIELPSNFGQSNLTYSVSAENLPEGVNATVKNNKIIISDSGDSTQNFQLTLTVDGAVKTSKIIDVFVAQLDDFNLPEQIDMESGSTKTLTVTIPEEFDESNVLLKIDTDSLPEGFSATINENEITLTASNNFAQVVQVDFYLSTSSDIRKTIDVFVSPLAPLLTLNEESDTGSKDGITKINNIGDTLKFTVSGLYNEAELQLWIRTESDDSTLSELQYDILTTTQIPDSNLFEYTIAVQDNESSHLADGKYSIFASQFFPIMPVYNHDPLISPSSNLIDLTIDTVELEITSEIQNIYSLTVDETFSLTLLTNKVDAAGNQRSDLTYSIQGESTLPNNLTFENGILSWTPSNDDIGWEHSLILTITDGAGFTAQKELTLTLATGPDFEILGDTTVNELETITVRVLIDPEEYSSEYSFEIIETTLPEGSEYSFEEIENGKSFVWTTTESDGPGEYSISFKLTTQNDEGNPAYTVKSVTLVINEANQLPVIDFDATNPIEVSTQQLFEITITAHDDDLPAQSLSFALDDNAPEGMTINTETGLLSWTPTDEQGNQEFDVTVSVQDSLGGSAETTLHFIVKITDNPPVFETIETQTVKTEETLSFRVVASDPNKTNSLEYSFSGNNIPENMTINATTGVVSWTVPADWIADSSVKEQNLALVIIATEITGQNEDESNIYGLSTSITVSVIIENANYIDPEAVDNTQVNQPPSLGSISSWNDWLVAWRANAEYRFNELANSSSRFMNASASAKETKNETIVQKIQDYQNQKITKSELIAAVDESEKTYQSSLNQYWTNHQTRTKEIERLALEQKDELVGQAATLDSNSDQNIAQIKEETNDLFDFSDSAFLFDENTEMATPIDLSTSNWFSAKPILTDLFKLSSISFESATDVVLENTESWE
ncbi:MAG: peptidylprolyl isomerase [Planctomycetia bacterium]|nr:peptidylprolyl isomerase [Planctomycetia bacterium]